MDGGSIVGIVLLLGAAVIIFFAVEGRDVRLKKEAANAPPPPRQIALIAQHSQMNGTGVFGAALLAVTIVTALLIVIASKTVFGEIEAGIVMIVGTLLSGIALVLGRTQSYRVYQIEAAPPAVPAELAEPLHHWTK